MITAADLPALPAATPEPWLRAMLDAVDYPMLLLDRDRVRHANLSARLVLDGPLPLQVDDDGRLVPTSAADRPALAEAIEAAAHRRLRRLLTLRADGATAHVAVQPVGEGEPGPVLVTLGKPDLCGDLTVAFYARCHGLSPAETQVLDRLCAGLDAREIAARQGVALTTVRTQILAIREKTGTDSILAVVRRLSMLPPVVQRPLQPPRQRSAM